MSSKEIARAIGISPVAIRVRLNRGRARLKKEMLAMMDTAFEGRKLPIGFTFHIVESVKRIKIHPTPRLASLPWGLSLAVGIIVTVLSLNPHLSITSDIDIPAGSPLPAETKALKTGEIPVDVLRIPNTPDISSRPVSVDAGKPAGLNLQNGLPVSPQGRYVTGGQDKQNGVSLAPGGQEYAFVRSWPEEILGLRAPSGVAVDSSGNVYVADSSNYCIQEFDSEGKFLMKWGTYGSGDGEFDDPNAIAIDSAGNVYVADSNNRRIQKFDSTGRFLMKWGTEGDGDGQFKYLGGIAIDSAGNVYVADSYNQRIQEFDPKGKFLAKWGTYGTGDMEFACPYDIAIGSSGYIYVADSGNSRIKVYRQVGGSVDPANKQMGTWGGVKRTELYQNYPNPFNPETWIPFSLSESEHVTIRIYSSAGQLVRTLDLGQKPSGTYLSKEKAAYWDGRNENGEPVASDVYFCALDGGDKDLRKMVMAR